MDEEYYQERATELAHRLHAARVTNENLAKIINELKDEKAALLAEIETLKEAQQPMIGVYDEYAQARALLEANGFVSRSKPVLYGVFVLLATECMLRAEIFHSASAEIEEQDQNDV